MPRIERPTQLRLWGFILTVGGGALIAVGALLAWASVDFQGITETTVGVDVKPGKVCLALGILAILALLVLRVSHSIPLRRGVAAAVVVVGLVALILGVREVTIKDHLLYVGLRDFANAFSSQNGLPATDLATRIKAELKSSGTVNVGIGLWLTIAGGAVTIVGGVLDVLWVQSRARAHAAVDAPPPRS